MSHTILMDPPFELLNFQEESPIATASQLEHTMRPQILLPTSQTGESESNQILTPSAPLSQRRNAKSSESLSANLPSLAKPQELLERPPEVRILKVSKADLAAFCQVITEFQEQFNGSI